jgi:sigma-E factor negative regulatory protein RseC
MSESEAIVTRVDGDFLTVEVAALPSACGKCGEKGGCGKPPAGPRYYAIRNTIGAHAGDRVIVSVPSGAVLKAAVLSYLMPLLFVFAGAGIANHFFGDDLAAVLGAVIGLAAGLVVLRQAGRREPMLTLTLQSRVFNIVKGT